MKKYLIILSIVLLSPSTWVKAQHLEEYLIEAAENNPGIQARYSEFEASLQKIGQTNSIPNPILSIGYFVSPIETRLGPQTAKFSLTQMFPWFGTSGAKEDAAKLIAESMFQDFLEAKNELFFKIRAAYYPLYEVQVQLNKQKENLQILNTYKSLATASFSNSKGSMADVIRVDIIIENALTEIQILEGLIKPLEIEFNKLLNRTDSLPVIILDTVKIIPVQDYKSREDSLIATNPILKSVDSRIQSAIAEEEVARKQGAPSIGIGIDYSIVGKRTDIDIPENGRNAIMPMISVSLPIYRKKHKSSVKEAQYIQAALLSSKEELTNNLMTAFEMAKYEIEKTQLLYHQYNRQIEKTRQVIELLYSEYSNSGDELEEILRMQQQLLRYEMLRATTVKNYSIAVAKLDYLSATSLESWSKDM